MIRRSIFDEVNGFDEEFVITYNDIDLCMKVRQKGYAVLWTPHAELYHFESVTRGYSEKPEDSVRYRHEHERFHTKWADVLPAVDPYYNPHLTRRYPLDGSLRTERDQELPAAA